MKGAVKEMMLFSRSSLKDLDADLYRFFGPKKVSFFQKLMFSPEIKYIALLRKAQGSKCNLMLIYYRYRLRKKRIKTQIQIPHNTKIGPVLYIGHLGRIVVDSNTCIGSNVNLSTGVTIGQIPFGPRKGSPRIGNHVWIGTNAVIVGNVSVGDHSLIAPNSFVNFNVPANSLVIGNPGIIKRNYSKTNPYILFPANNDTKIH